jgi:predicted transcriptional regulator
MAVEKKERKNTSIRLGETLDDLIDQYAAFMGISRSKVIRNVLMEGLFQKTKAAQFAHFEKWIGKREAFTLLTKCEKCDSEKNLGFFHIDGNIDNNSTNNIVTLCIPCINSFQNWKLKENSIEKFIEWFFA